MVVFYFQLIANEDIDEDNNYVTLINKIYNGNFKKKKNSLPLITITYLDHRW